MLLFIFPPSSHSIILFFFSCRPFVVTTTFSSGLVGCWSFFCLKKTCWECRGNAERPTAKKNITIERDDGGKIGKKINSNWNLPTGAWNIIFKSIPSVYLCLSSLELFIFIGVSSLYSYFCFIGGNVYFKMLRFLR